MTALIGIFLFIIIIILAIKIIGYVLMAGSIGLFIHTLKSKGTYTKKRVALSIIVAVFAFMVGGSLAFPDSDQKKNNISSENNGTETVQSVKDDKNPIPIVPIAADSENEDREDATDIENDTAKDKDDEYVQESKDDTDSSKSENIAPVIALETATVTKHVDGDTVYVKLENGKEYKLRMIGVDTPETVHPTKGVEFYGKEASNFTESTLLGQTVYLEKDVSETDRYDRLLRYIWLEQPTEISREEIKSKMFNAILVANGYAQVSTYPPDVKYQDYFTDFAKEAREKELGLWVAEQNTDQSTTNTSSSAGSSTTSTANVSNFEDKSDTNKDYPYVGNSNTMKLHKVSCSHAKKISEHNRVYYKTKDEALNVGYDPCKVCKP